MRAIGITIELALLTAALIWLPAVSRLETIGIMILVQLVFIKHNQNGEKK